MEEKFFFCGAEFERIGKLFCRISSNGFVMLGRFYTESVVT